MMSWRVRLSQSHSSKNIKTQNTQTLRFCGTFLNWSKGCEAGATPPKSDLHGYLTLSGACGTPEALWRSLKATAAGSCTRILNREVIWSD